MEVCECCGRTDEDFDDETEVTWFLYDECEVILCSRCARRLGAKEIL